MYAFACAVLVEDSPNPGSFRHAHDWVGADFGEGGPASFGQGVVERDGSDEMFTDEGERRELRGHCAGGSDQRQVDVAGSDSLDKTVGVVLDQGDLDSWMSVVERREDLDRKS